MVRIDSPHIISRLVSKWQYMPQMDSYLRHMFKSRKYSDLECSLFTVKFGESLMVRL